MGSLNKAILIGRLGNDVELKHLPSGHAVATINIATNEKWKDKDGKPNEKTEWHRVNVWGDDATNAAKYLSKGALVYIEGRIETRTWEDKQGQKRYTTEIRCSKIIYIESKRQDNGQHREEAAPPPGQEELF